MPSPGTDILSNVAGKSGGDICTFARQKDDVCCIAHKRNAHASVVLNE